jgi:hypothetical protein
MGIVNINEKNMMFGFNVGGKHELLIDTLIFISSVFGRLEIKLNMTKFI